MGKFSNGIFGNFYGKIGNVVGSSWKTAFVKKRSEAKYKLDFNKTAGMNSRYKLSFPGMHQGMLEIQGIANFSLVFLHIGNYTSNTSGCPLTGHYWNFLKGDYQVMQSSFAYQQVYKLLAKEVKGGNQELVVMNRV